MRLIDADVFEVFAYTHTSDEFDDGVQFVLEKIDAAPTIDPVRHGRWVEFVNEDGYLDLRCSLCGEGQYVTFVRFNYCSNCGARMKEKD